MNTAENPQMNPLEWTDHAISSVAHKVTLWASAISVFSWLKNIDVGLWAGILIGLAGLLVNAYFKYKDYKLRQLDDRRKQEEHDAKMLQFRSLHVPQNLAP